MFATAQTEAAFWELDLEFMHLSRVASLEIIARQPEISDRCSEIWLCISRIDDDLSKTVPRP
jgi:hypothetical protein